MHAYVLVYVMYGLDHAAGDTNGVKSCMLSRTCLDFISVVDADT